MNDQPEPPTLPASVSALADAAPDAHADALFHAALSRLADPNGAWLRSGVWIQSHIPGLTYVGEGKYQRAPGQRSRLEVAMKARGGARKGKVTSEVLTVCDGTDYWQAARAGSGEFTTVQRLRLGVVLSALDAGTNARAVRQEFLDHQAVCGPEQMLRGLQAAFHWVRCEPGQEGHTLTGAWMPATRAVLAKRAAPWPALTPRLCRLVLRDGTLWPIRVEWWGPAEERGPDRLLVEMEFRDPVAGQVLGGSECARLFRFNPGDRTVTDLTPQAEAAWKWRLAGP